MTSSEAPLPQDYPQQWEADVVLRDGTVAQVRPIVPADKEALQKFHAGQSAQSIYLRFFAPIKQLSDREANRFTQVDYHARVALVMTIGTDLIGIARYDRLDAPEDHTAEVAFNVSDHFQGRGVGSVLLEHLVAIGQDAGVQRFVADVLPQNRKMLSVFREAGYEVTHRFDDGVVELGFGIKPTERSEQVRADREQRAESRSLAALLAPSSVVVIGVSRTKHSVGRQVLRAVRAGGFGGAIHAVTRDGADVDGHPTVASVAQLPDQIDLAIVAVPAETVVEVAVECAEHGVRSLLVLSGGFAEADPAGAARQQELLRAVRTHGMRIVGPNSFGVINTRPDVSLNASLAVRMPQVGRVGLFAQSGALAVAMLAMLEQRRLGLSDFVSAGNRADVSGNDLMQYWFDDEGTDAVALYLESMGNPRKFSRIARRLSARKPVIVVKSDMSTYAAPRGHTVRTTKAGPSAFRAMLRQAGVIRVESTHQMFDVAQLVAHQPLPAGPRVAIVGNADALGVLAADAAGSRGLDVTHGPVSLPPDASPADFEQALTAAFTDPDVDSVIAAFIPPLVTEGVEVAQAVAATAASYEKPCVSVFLGIHGLPDVLTAERSDGSREVVPSYAMPEDAVRALHAATRYAEWRQRDHGQPVEPDGIDRARAEELVRRVLAETPTGRALRADEAAELLDCYGIALWPVRAVESADEAVEAAQAIGYPVVLKSVSPLVRHQPVTALRGDITSDTTMREAFAALDARLAPLHANRFVVQRMATPGVAAVAGSSEDPLFGPVVRFSLSGAPTELLDDIGYRFPPLTSVDVRDLLGSPKAAPLLNGHRGAEPVDKDALEDLLARIGVLADQLAEVAELDLNPVNCHPRGADVLGATIALEPPGRRTDLGRRSLS